MRHLGIFTAVVFSVTLLWEFTSAALANGSRPEALRNVGFDQKLNEQVPLDLTFRNEDGRAVKLGEYFGKKPVILMFMYYECPNLCPLALDGLIKSLKPLSFTVGTEFDVLTISVDPSEEPRLAAAKKQEYLPRYGRNCFSAEWQKSIELPKNRPS